MSACKRWARCIRQSLPEQALQSLAEHSVHREPNSEGQSSVPPTHTPETAHPAAQLTTPSPHSALTHCMNKVGAGRTLT